MYVLVPAITPKSGGCLRLESADPCDDPIINMDYLKHPDDLENFVKAAKLVFDLLKTKIFKKSGIHLHDVPLPLCSSYKGDDYIRCVLKKYSLSIQDPTGGATIGTVIDENLKVKEVKKLRICDPSIVPEGFTGPTRTLSAMLGEKCADMVKKDCGITFGKCN